MTSLTSRWSRTLSRTAAVSFTSALALLVFAGPALADTTIPLKEAHKNVKAAEFTTKKCSKPGGQLPQLPGQDGWHFVLPSKSAPDAEFVKVTLTFEDLEGNPVDREAIIGNPTNKHAIVYTPAGWTLLDGTADITGETDKGPKVFNLSHTCPAPDESPSPSPSDSESPSPAPSDTESPSPSESPTVAPSDTESPSVAPSSPAPAPGDDLPVTGLAIGGIVLTGLGLVGAGAAMRLLRRKNDAETDDGETPTDV